ncbi:hypothetical protein [Aquimarina sp. Aq107]|uniref:hypothetical protein n=1 Tax=Aquimarina sp. Aq107 TaxID=1191912 RepID=UPI00131F26BE|nr:hypothetical protein [Aquimarina sp. Aq107]
MRKILFIIYLAPIFLFCQTPLLNDGCSDVLRLSSRDVTIESTRATTAKYIYDNYCSGKSAKGTINIKAVDEDLFESFSFGFGSKKEKLEHICKTYQSNYKASYERNINKSHVVRDAISAWEKCKELSNQGINIRPSLLKSSFTVDVRRIGDDIEINGVYYDTKACECKAQIKNTFGQLKTTLVNSDTKHKIKDGNTWSVICTRKKMKEGDMQFYPEFDFKMPTSKGSFNITLPKNVKPTHSWITEVISEIEDLKVSIRSTHDTLQKQISRVDNRFGKIKWVKKCTDANGDCNGARVSGITAPKGYNFAFYTQDTYRGGKCGKGSKCKVFYKIEL